MKVETQRNGGGSSKLIWLLGSVLSQSMSLVEVSSLTYCWPCGAASSIGVNNQPYISVATILRQQLVYHLAEWLGERLGRRAT